MNKNEYFGNKRTEPVWFLLFNIYIFSNYVISLILNSFYYYLDFKTKQKCNVVVVNFASRKLKFPIKSMTNQFSLPSTFLLIFLVSPLFSNLPTKFPILWIHFLFYWKWTIFSPKARYNLIRGHWKYEIR